MKRKVASVLCGMVLCLGSVLVCAEGLRTVGLCLALSWSDTPIWLGIEASTQLSGSVLSGALFITPAGKTLLACHIDVPLQSDAAAFLRLTAGVQYRHGQPFPYPLVGAGISYLALQASPVYAGFSGEFLYPIAFPLPLFSISGGWLP